MSTPTIRRPITETEYSLFLKRASEVGIANACRELGRTPQAYRYRTLKRGLTIDRLPTSYKVNPDQFTSIAAPEVAYILGLLWADGHVRTKYHHIGIELEKEDLLSVKPYFDKTGTWHYNERTRKGRTKPMASLNVSIPPIKAFLAECDYLTKSVSSPTKILERIPASLHPLFWRGYIDGDGCFYQSGRVCQFSLSGSLEQDWSSALVLCSRLQINGVVHKVKLKSGNSSALRITGRMDIEALGDWIYATYPSDQIGLPRKYAKFLAIKEQCEKSRTGRFAKEYARLAAARTLSFPVLTET